MSAPPRDQAPTLYANRLLRALPPDEAAQLWPYLREVRLQAGQVLYDVDTPIRQVSFPITAVISLLNLLEDGAQIEMAAIGREGFAGLPLALGVKVDMHRAMTQIGGTALQLDAERFTVVLETLPGLRRILLRYAQFAFTQAGQAAACNAAHAVAERCARWLLEAHDRVGRDSFALTQDFLASMLGVRRPSVTIAAGVLQQAGLIAYRRGQVTILDRLRLEQAACECYRLLAQESDRLLRGSQGQLG